MIDQRLALGACAPPQIAPPGPPPPNRPSLPPPFAPPRYPLQAPPSPRGASVQRLVGG